MGNLDIPGISKQLDEAHRHTEKYRNRVDILEQENNLCKLIVGDLIELLRFKVTEENFEAKRRERDIENESAEQKAIHEDLMERYEKLKQKQAATKKRYPFSKIEWKKTARSFKL